MFSMLYKNTDKKINSLVARLRKNGNYMRLSKVSATVSLVYNETRINH